ncbi:FtsQ-type POTRA domain-containing protein [Agromyces sp. LHK192]|uniref:FtsQ-type POTRA domain-containing protein n=1 Tax=Agromyces sp. LHK192 TaxID=2498704 RepID=UPI000FDB40B5|nr:FtsQ-type POTRA domain-containing protein [Agromyces sp. LHK192]
MKRPQGFDGPRPGRPGPVVPESRDPRADAAADAGDAVTTVQDRVTTEPIAIVAAPEPETARVQAPTIAGPDRERAGRERGDPAAGAAGTRPGSVVGSAAGSDPDPKAARRAHAKAMRDRRRYEREEVRRFTARSRHRRFAWLVGAGTVVVVSGGLVGAAYSPLMALREVRVEGAQRIPVGELQAAFAEDYGTPLPLITSADVRSALGEFPLIETYSTETVPPGTLVVRVVERTPVGVVDTPRGLELVDAAGVVIDRPEERPADQPLIDAGGVASKGFRAAAAVVRSLPPEVRGQVVRATAETVDDVRLELAGGASVLWGSSEDSSTKATVLARMMASAPPDTVSHYDVSAPMNPVTG